MRRSGTEVGNLIAQPLLIPGWVRGVAPAAIYVGAVAAFYPIVCEIAHRLPASWEGLVAMCAHAWGAAPNSLERLRVHFEQTPTLEAVGVPYE